MPKEQYYVVAQSPPFSTAIAFRGGMFEGLGGNQGTEAHGIDNALFHKPYLYS